MNHTHIVHIAREVQMKEAGLSLDKRLLDAPQNFSCHKAKAQSRFQYLKPRTATNNRYKDNKTAKKT